MFNKIQKAIHDYFHNELTFAEMVEAETEYVFDRNVLATILSTKEKQHSLLVGTVLTHSTEYITEIYTEDRIFECHDRKTYEMCKGHESKMAFVVYRTRKLKKHPDEKHAVLRATYVFD